MKVAWKRILPVSGAFLVALLIGCGNSQEKGEAPEASTHVTVATVTRGSIDDIVSADAVLYPVDQANIASKINSPVKRVLVNRGEHVKAGQLLVELESADLAAAVSESRSQYEQSVAAYETLVGATLPEDRTKAQADVKAAQQALDVANTLFANRVALQKEGALSMKLVDDAKLAKVQAQSALDTAQEYAQASNQVGRRESERSAEAQRAAAKAHYLAAQVQAGYAQVRSPIAGVVADRAVYPGEVPAPGTPLVSVVDISKVVARANVSVKEEMSVKPGRTARISSPEGEIIGKVTVVSPAVDPNSTTVEIWVEADNPGERLKPGQTVRVAIVAETLLDVMVAPVAALLNSEDGGQKAMVISSDSVAHARRVSTGVREGDRVQVLSGLQDGDRVVVSGGLGLDDGAHVVIEKAGATDDDHAASGAKDSKE